MSAAKQQNKKSASGLDSWSCDVVGHLQRDHANTLSEIYTWVARHGKWPQTLRKTRVSLLHKVGSPPQSPNSWRPISVTSIFYRLFSRICLNESILSVIEQLPTTMLGGLPKRSSAAAIVQVFLMIEKIRLSSSSSVICGISLDASKCFDKITWRDALLCGLDAGIHPGFMRALISFCMQHQRHTSIRSMLDENPWRISRGILQGCAASVLVTCTILRTWHHLSISGLFCYSFVDDRLLLGTSVSVLTRGWCESELWDIRHGWTLNASKTSVFAVGARPPSLTWQNQDIPIADQFQWLGHEFPLRYNLPRTLWPKRVASALGGFEKLAQIQVGPLAKQRAAEVALSPVFAFGLHAAPPPVSSLKRLAAAAKVAIWGRGRKHCHSWDLAVATIYKVHSLDPWSAICYQNIMWMLRGLQHQGARELLSEIPVGRIKAFGPAHAFRTYLEQLGLSYQNRRIIGQGIDHPASDLSLIAHTVRLLLRNRLFLRVAVRRKNLEHSGYRVDIVGSTKILRRRFLKDRSGYVGLFCDGVVTGERAVHFGRPSAACPYCNHDKEDIAHILWDCPQWARLRVIPPQIAIMVSALPAAARCCAYRLESLSPQLDKYWQAVQGQMAAIVVQHQSATCRGHMRNQAVPAPQPVPFEVPCVRSKREWRQAYPLELRDDPHLASSQNAWPYSRLQWNRLMQFMTSLRITEDRSAPLTLLEVYASYLLLNGQIRFQYEVADRMEGDWWTFQLAHFTRALRILQAHSLSEPILTAADCDGERVEWTKVWNIPAQQVMTERRLILMNHAEVRDFLQEWSERPAPVGEFSVGAEVWRRSPIGIPHSQMEPAGSLCDQSISWALPSWGQHRRIRYKASMASWVSDYVRHGSFRSAIFKLAAEEPRVRQICMHEGIVSCDGLSRCAGRYTKKAKTLCAWRQLNIAMESDSSHIVKPAGARAICALCGDLSPLSHIQQWARRSCSHVSGGRGMYVSECNSMMENCERELTSDAARLRCASRSLAELGFGALP